jgi:outer membrane lipoprotein-sorting protein
MTSIKGPDVATEELLDEHIEAARRQFDAAGIENATRRFREKLSRGRAGRQRVFRWPSLVGAASALLVSVLAVSLLVPGTNGTAFAQAQQWLASFRTLHAETTVVAGDVVTNVSAWLDESGDTRIESSGSTTIIKPETGMLYILMPDGQSYAQPIASERIVGSATEFIDNILAFQGQADLLTESRVIDGITARGYALESDTGTDVLWVDPADGKPLLVESLLQGGITTSTTLQFDVPLPEDAFEIPDEAQRIDREVE